MDCVLYCKVSVPHSTAPRTLRAHNGVLLISAPYLGSVSSFPSVQFNHSVMSDSLWPHELWHTRLLCLSPTSKSCSNSCPSSQWCHPTISFSVIPFSSCLQSFPASVSLPVSQFFASCGQSIGVFQHQSFQWIFRTDFLLGWTGLISLQSKGLSRIFSNTTVQKHQFFCAQLSLESNSHIQSWLLEKPQL